MRSTTSATRWRELLALLALVVLTLAAFAPVARYAFINGFGDDEIHVFGNAFVRSASWSAVVRFWQGPYERLFIPVSYTFYVAMAKVSTLISGGDPLNPLPYHLASLGVHVANAALLYWIFARRLRLPTAAALGGALVFALHPLQAQAVSWVSGARDLLASGFSLAAILVYLGAPARRPRVGDAGRFLAVALLAVLAVLAKPSASVLLASFPLVELCRDARSWRRAAAYTGPLLLAWVPLTWWLAKLQPNAFINDIPTLPQRLLLAGDTFAFYLGKVVWPAGLGPDYGRTPAVALADPLALWGWPVLAVTLAIALLSKRRRELLGAYGLFLISLAPVSGLIPFTHQIFSTVADRYAYFAMVGPAVAVAVLLAALTKARIPAPRSARWQAVPAALFVSALAVSTRATSRHYRDVTAFSERILVINPATRLAHYLLGQEARRLGDLPAAEKHFRDAIAVNATDWIYHRDLAGVLRALGKVAAADAEKTQAKQLYRDTFLPIASELNAQGLYGKAWPHLSKLLQDFPDDPSVHYEAAHSLAGYGRYAEAVRELETALKLRPDYAAAAQVLERLKAEM
jgi:Flp pilus assembly protein TadD